ncbi:MAG TPA: DUF4145 domain-containing protein [Bosea sp. (in: a-proteobacteria)]|jgi:hypothetical protein|uniref:DUF4145 domain-containing protein n=1 Tax=Bosea sp. (in: a-proteobacteria) TaxID=1871050 RepID=UPI002E0FBAB1|nr:DUF4145 domain-containing protein [Bosea sp. (in: a-proteobacteria)]
MKYVAPSIRETAFNCPHCQAFTSQTWLKLNGSALSQNESLPRIITDEDDHDWSSVEKKEERASIKRLVKEALKRRPFFPSGEREQWGRPLENLWLSRCFNCKEMAVWVYDGLVFPRMAGGPPANPDTPDAIRPDYEEASAILDASPRGAAALLRLCIQKLCKHLGQPGDNINSDIKALVAAGIGSHLQKALDAVRVIGNNAVHPGTLDLRDDRATAETLFRLFNLIVDKTVSEKRLVDEVYSTLPAGALEQIEKRDRRDP